MRLVTTLSIAGKARLTFYRQTSISKDISVTPHAHCSFSLCAVNTRLDVGSEPVAVVAIHRQRDAVVRVATTLYAAAVPGSVDRGSPAAGRRRRRPPPRRATRPRPGGPPSSRRAGATAPPSARRGTARRAVYADHFAVLDQEVD